MPVSPSDAELAGQALAGSESAFRELVARYAAVTVNFIARMVHDRALAEDLAQDAFIRAFQRLSGYDPQRKFSSWFFQVAHNVTIDHLRRKKLQTVSLDQLVEHGHPGTVDDHAGSSPAAQAEAGALASALELALARIRPEHRAAIVLHYQEGFGHSEISSILGVPIGTVKTYLHRGRKELARLLSAQGWGPVRSAETPGRRHA
jgi:RNA polymerase sigma-70 factor (ECF subfamily)